MKKDIIKNIILITIFFIILLIIIMTISIIMSITGYKNKNYYIIGNDKIPSIYSIVGERKLYKYKTYNKDNVNFKLYKYRNIKNPASDISKYILELKDNYNFIYTSDVNLSNNNGIIELSTNSIDNNKIIIIKILYDNNSYDIELSKGNGKINIFQ